MSRDGRSEELNGDGTEFTCASTGEWSGFSSSITRTSIAPPVELGHSTMACTPHAHDHTGVSQQRDTLGSHQVQTRVIARCSSTTNDGTRSVTRRVSPLRSPYG